jgi:hypothetical protein
MKDFEHTKKILQPNERSKNTKENFNPMKDQNIQALGLQRPCKVTKDY